MSVTKGALLSLPSLADAVRAVRDTDAARKAAEKNARARYDEWCNASTEERERGEDHHRACAVLSAVLEREVPDA